MKKNKILLLSILSLMTLISCKGEKKETSNNSSDTSSFESSESISSSRPSIGPITPSTGNDSDTVLNLIINSGYVDIDNAKTSTNEVEVIGYDNGRRYNQTQKMSSTTYLNDLTITHGNVSQFFYDNEEVKYSDEFNQVKQIKDYNYISVTDYVGDVFQDETQKINLLLGDINELTETIKSARSEVSCGLGSSAFEDLYNVAVTNDASLRFTTQKDNNNNFKVFIYAEAENEQSNQKYIAQFEYIFSSLEEGFLLEYSSTQSYYSLSAYLQEEDKSKLVPTYYAHTIGSAQKGTLEAFEDDLPVDTSSTFVSTINVSASKTTIEVDEEIALKYEVLPATALNKDVIFISSNESVARVDSFGKVIGIGVGTCEISVINVESEVEGKITITVTEKAKPDAGDDSKKGDLQKALLASVNQILGYTRWIGGTSVDSITGMCIDSEQKLNAEALLTLSISDFYYNENKRQATYVGDLNKLKSLLPFYDNGNELLDNNYLLKGSSTIYRDVILDLNVYLAGNDTVSYVEFSMRCDYVEFDKATINFASLTNENIDETVGNFKLGYKRSLYYISEGFVANEE